MNDSLLSTNLQIVKALFMNFSLEISIDVK